MSDFVMMDYINETQEAALHIVDKSEDLCRVFAENFAKKYKNRSYIFKAFLYIIKL